MKKFKFIPLFCGLLFAGNSHANNDFLEHNEKDVVYYTSACSVSNLCPIDLYRDSLVTFKNIKPNSNTFKFDSRIQRRMFKNCINKRPFFAYQFKYDTILHVGNTGISRGEKFLEDYIKGIEPEKKYIYKNAYSVRKFVFDILKNYDKDNRCIDIHVPRVFFILPDDGNSDINSMLEQDEKMEAIYKTIATMQIIYIVMSFFDGTSNLDYHVDANEVIKSKHHYDANMKRSVTESKFQKIAKLQIQLNSDSSLYTIQDDFIDYCKNIFNTGGLNIGEFSDQVLNFLKMCRGNLFIGTSKIYMYISIPNDSVKEVEKLSMGVFGDLIKDSCKCF